MNIQRGFSLLAIVLLLAVVGAGYWLYQSQSSPEKISVTDAIDSAKLASELSEGNREYKNEQFGFSFLLPRELMFVETFEQAEGTFPPRLTAKLINQSEGEGVTLGRIQVNSRYGEGTEGPSDTFETSELSIGGERAEKIVVNGSYVLVRVSHEGNSYRFNFPYSSNEERALADKIFTTFSFGGRE